MVTNVYAILGDGGLGITGIRNYARAEIALRGAVPPNVLLVEVDLCSLTGRDEEPSISGLVPPEQYLVLQAPDVNLGARCAALSPDDPIRKCIDISAVCDIGNTGTIGGNQRPIILQLVALLEPAWWESIVGHIGQAIHLLAETRGLSLGTVHIKILRSTLGTVGAGGMILTSSLQDGLRQINTSMIDSVFLLADYAERVPDRRRARASTAAALDEIDRRARGIFIAPGGMFKPISGVHVLSEGFSETAVLEEDAVLSHLLVAGKLEGPLVSPLTLRNNTRDRAEAATAMTGRILVADSATLRQRTGARMAAQSANALANTPGGLSVDAQVEALLSSTMSNPGALTNLIGRNLGIRNTSKRLVNEIGQEAGRAVDREVFARADGIMDDEELRTSAESKVYAFTMALKTAADQAMDRSLSGALGLFSSGVTHLHRYREDLLRFKETREQDAATCRNKVNAAAGQAAATEATRSTPAPRLSIWGFVKTALTDEKPAAPTASDPADLNNLRVKYTCVRGELQIIGALTSAIDHGVSVVRAYETEISALRELVLSASCTFDRMDDTLGHEAVERIRRFAGVSLAAEDDVVDALVNARLRDGTRAATEALARLGATEIASINRVGFERAMWEVVEDLLGPVETFSLDGVVGQLPPEMLDRIARSLVPTKPPVNFDPGVSAPGLFSVVHVGHPRMSEAVRRTSFGRNRVTVCPAPEGSEYFAVTYTGVFSVKDIECYGRAKAAFNEAVEENWAGQIVDRRVLDMPDDSTDDGALEMLVAKAVLAGSLQASAAGRWYHVDPSSGIFPADLDSASLHAAFGDCLGSGIAETVRTLRSKPSLRRDLSSSWDGYVLLRTPRQMVESIDAVVASGKLRKLSGCFKSLKSEFLKALRDSAFDGDYIELKRVGRNGNGAKEESYVA